MNQPIWIPLPTSFAIGPANAFLFTEPEVTLVDCGIDSDESWAALVDALANHALTVADIQHVVVTHAHVDHMGMAGRIIAHSHADLWIWEQIAEWASRTEARLRSRQDFLRYTLNQYDMATLQRDSILNGMGRARELWSSVPENRITTFSLTDQLQMGGAAWDILHMPGHSNTQTCFYQPESQQFIAADMLLALTPAPIMEQPLSGGLEREPCMERLMASYELVYNMEIQRVYPGHGEPFSDYRTLIDAQRSRIAMRKDECYQLVRQGKKRVGDILDVMYAHHPETARFSGMTTVVAYLDLLLAEGVIREVIEDGMRRYVAT